MAAPLVPPRRGGRLPAAAAATAAAGISPQPAAFGLGTNASRANARITSSGTVSDYAHDRPRQTLQAKAAGRGATKADSGQRAVASKMQVDMTSTAHCYSACYLAAVTGSYNCRPPLEEANPGDLLVITWWHTLDQSWGQLSSSSSDHQLDVCSMAAIADWEDAFSRAAATPSTMAIDCPDFCTESGCALQERCPFYHSAARHQWCCSRAMLVKQAMKENSSSDEQYTMMRAGPSSLSSFFSGGTMDNSNDLYRHRRRLSLADQMGDISVLDHGLANEENLLA
eukprot:SM000127S26666  [mRNA]  locus=s127:407145:409376:- [translate_table: standard]